MNGLFVEILLDRLSMNKKVDMGEFVVEGFFFFEVVTFFVTLWADLEDYFKCKT